MAAQSATHFGTETADCKIKIMRQTYRCDERNMMFILKDHEGNTFEKTAAEIARDRHLIQQMSKNDIVTVSFIAGMEIENNNLYM